LAYQKPFAYIDKYNDMELELFFDFIQFENPATIALILTNVQRDDILSKLFEHMDNFEGDYRMITFDQHSILISMMTIGTVVSSTVIKLVNKMVKETMDKKLKNLYKLDTSKNKTKVANALANASGKTLSQLLESINEVDEIFYKSIVSEIEKTNPEKLIL